MNLNEHPAEIDDRRRLRGLRLLAIFDAAFAVYLIFGLSMGDALFYLEALALTNFLTWLACRHLGPAKARHYWIANLAPSLYMFGVLQFRLYCETNGQAGHLGVLYMIVGLFLLPLPFIDAITAVVTKAFMSWLDSSDDDYEEPYTEAEEIDELTRLLKEGKQEEALKHCHGLNKPGGINPRTLETIFIFHGTPESAEILLPLTKAKEMRSQQNFLAAEDLLKKKLARRPDDVEAALLLMRIYAEDLHSPDAAKKILKQFCKRNPVKRDFIAGAEASIAAWSRPKPKEKYPAELPATGSVSYLLAQGYYGSAIEILEGEIEANPKDLDLRLQLAEVFAVRCGEIERAGKVIQKMQRIFSPEQMEVARAKLKQWRETPKPQGL
ncbi:MAG: hypothetical protein WCH99_18950 [Verrucomicrobiota bacterium]